MYIYIYIYVYRCENEFKVIQEANSLIGTSDARKKYDNSITFRNYFQPTSQNNNHNTNNRYYQNNPYSRHQQRSHQYNRRRFYVNGVDVSHFFNPSSSSGSGNNSMGSSSSSSSSFFQNPFFNVPHHNTNSDNDNDASTTQQYNHDNMPKSIFVQKVSLSLEELYNGVSSKEFAYRETFLQPYRAAFRGGIATQIVLQGIMT
jgi:hypothetical protein